MADGQPAEYGSTIRDDERREILDQIDLMTESHKLEVTDDLFVVEAGNKGVLFPILVNVGALVAILASVFLLTRIFGQDSDAFQQSRRVYASVENQLIRQLREESRNQLQSKESEIRDVQQRLQAVAEERNSLLSSMEDRIREREAALRDQLAQELATERDRLQGQGMAGTRLENQLASFERSRAEEADRTLAEFRSQLETERQRLEEDLARAQREYNSRLDELATERDQLVASYQQRETELQQQLAMRTRALESDRDAAQTGLAQAQARLSELTRNREAERQLQAQVTGYLSSIRDAVQRGAYPEARATMASFRSFVDPPGGTPVTYSRREMDLFLVNTLDRMVAETMERAAAADSISADLTQLQTLRSFLADGARFRDTENPEDAVASYSAAFASLPGLAAAHDYLVQREVDRERLSAQEVIEPLRSQNERFVDQIDTLQSQNANLTDRVGILGREVTDSRGRLEAQDTAMSALSDRIATMTTRLAAASAGLDEANARAQELNAARDRLAAQLAAARSEITSLQRRSTALDDLERAYREFRSQETAALNADALDEDAAALRGKFALDSFLGSTEVQRFFPGVLDRIHTYDGAFENAGYRAALLDVSDILEEISFAADPPQQAAYIERQIAESADDPERLRLLSSLQLLLSDRALGTP